MKPSSSSSSSTQHLIDKLTSHIALYHSSSSNPNSNPHPRSAILRWLSSLRPPTLQSILTFTDPKFTQILIQMHSHLARNGPTLFFLLPDLPSDPLCTRKCHGLLARKMEIVRPSISSNLLLFGLKDESVLDSVTVGKELVEDVDGFVGLVDAVTNGRFLRGEETGLGEEGKEMGWLKDKGYFSLEEFVANRLEVVLRVSWGKRKGKKGSASEGVGESACWRRNGCVDWWMGLELRNRREFSLGFLGKAAESLANEIVEGKNTVLWRKNGLFDIEAELPKKYDLNTSLESSKMPILRSDSNVCCDIIPGPGMLNSLAKLLNRLLILQEISSIVQACQLNKVEKETLFFSRLGSVLTVSDCIMRKFRGLIMAVSVDYVSRELLGDVKLNTLPIKIEGKKLNMASQKGKKKSRNSKREDSMHYSSGANSATPDPTMVEGKKLNMASHKGKKKFRDSKREDSMHYSSGANSATLDPTMNNECMADYTTDRAYQLCTQEDNNPIAANLETDKVEACTLPKDPGKEHAMLSVDSKGPADRKRRSKKVAKHKKSSSKKVSKAEIEINETSVSCVSAENNVDETVGLADISTPHAIYSDVSVRNSLLPMSTSCGVPLEPCIVDDNKVRENAQEDHSLPVADNCSAIGCYSGSDNFGMIQTFAKDEKNPQMSPCMTNGDNVHVKLIDSFVNCLETESSVIDNEHMLRDTRFTEGDTLTCIPPKHVHAAMKTQGVAIQTDGHDLCIHNHIIRGTSYEWPSITPLHLTSSNSPHLPAATDRLHLEVGYKQPNHFHHSFMPSRHQARNSVVDGVHGRLVPSLTSPISCDWPPVVKSCGRLNQTVTLSYDSAFNPPLPHSFCSGFAAHAAREMQINGASSENDSKHSGDIFDIYDFKTASEFPDDTESYWLSEEENDTHAFSGRDYNQFFGGGVMYWNPAEHVGKGFSRPPSHSSEDSCWAWYEADLNRAIDDMVGMPALSTSFNTNGMTSPPAASFCSPFAPIGSGHQPIGFTVPINDSGKVLHSSTSDVPEERSSVSLNNLPGCVEGVKADILPDTLPYTLLRPIIVPRISREGSRSEFKVSLDHNSPCLPSTRRDHPRIERPPSPVVLCVPRVPRPPSSSVGESKKRGFPIVRSGSSSPRHWGMKNFYHEDGNMEDPRLCLDGAEVVWPSWGTKGLAGTPVAQSIQGSLLQNHLISISQRACDQEHPDVALPLQPPDLLNCPHKASLSLLHNQLHEEIDFFCKKVAAENLTEKPYINWAVKRVTRSLQDLWPRSRTNIFGSNSTGLALPTSDVDLVVSLPPVRNLEPIKEAGILEGRNGIKETCLQHAARYLANQDWVRNDSLKTIENTAIPVIMLMAEVPQDINYSNGNSCVVEVTSAQATDITTDATLYSDHSRPEDTSLVPFSTMRKNGGADVKSVRLDISFKSSSHTGLQTSKLVRELTQQFPASVPLALVLKKFLADRSLDHSYSGGLSSYCLVLLITRFLQHEHHVGRPVSQNLGSLLMDFLYFFGNVFDPRQMRISIQGSGVYMKRERGLSIDPIHIDDPLFPSNNVGRNCFRIHQCIKAFADAYSLLDNEISQFLDDRSPYLTESFELLRKIIPNIDRVG